MPHRLTSIATATVAALGFAGVAATQAQALTVTSDASGLKMVEPGFNRAAIKLSIEAGGTKYRLVTPNFGGKAVFAGPGCTNASTVGEAIAICDRITPKVAEVNLGPGPDTFEVDPAFPDPIVVNDVQRGPDRYKLGAGADVAKGSVKDSFEGRGGNDDLTTSSGILDGAGGNDRLHALNVGNFTNTEAEMTGGEGNDALSADGRALYEMTGGPGTDSYDAGGGSGRIDSRDGIKENVVCGIRKPGVPRLRLINDGGRRFAIATIDLVDTPDNAAMIAGGCTRIDRAPRGEKTAAQLASTKLKVKRGKVAVKVRCTTSKRCTGKVSVKVKGRTAAKRFSIRGKRTGTIRLAARRGTATVTISEKGKRGARTTRAALPATR
ncbi:MAG TPA: hypothetical protein VEX39_04055 [Thermoleophilaceae bacterium]|nr:hypothetical protein [Thermoleophilaceae bacterium]